MPSPCVPVELHVELPRQRRALAAHVLDVLFARCLGWAVRMVDGEGDHAIVVGPDGRRCVLASPFLAMPADRWCTRESLPETTTEVWDGAVGGSLPAVWGRGGRAETIRVDADTLRLDIDVIGLAAVLLTGYEERIVRARDAHRRFSARDSLLGRGGWLNRALVDEAAEVLHRALTSHWPGLPAPVRSFALELSHDVDHPFRYAHGALRTARHIARDLARDAGRPRALARTLGRVAATALGHDASDPWYTFDPLLALAERWGTRHTFYVFGGRTDRRLDAKYDPSGRRMRRLLARLDRAGHEIGLHPSYRSIERPGQLGREAARLSTAMARAGLRQRLRATRQHFLRLDVPHTQREAAEAGLRVEASMGFADAIGFRAGICRPFPWFDLELNRRLDLEVRPLSVMEVTVFREAYMGLGESPAAVDAMREIRAVCERHAGTFSLLWHNDNLSTPRQRELFAAIAAP